MRYSAIDSKLFENNRLRFVSQLLQGSMAVFFSNDLMPTNADGTMGFKQNSDMFYLSGIDQEDTILILFPEHPQKEYRQILFVKETNETIAIWEGNKLSKEEAKATSGIEHVYWTHQFEQVLKNVIFDAENIYLNTNEHTRAEHEVITQNDSRIKWFKEKFPLHNYKRAAPILQQLRMIKNSQEIALIKNAVDITELAFRRLLSFVKPGVHEYEIEAEIIHEFIRNKSRGPAYASIVASGLNACVLHYTDNNQKCKKGDLILMDFGAEYANYAADLTRCLPVSGKFSNRQKEVYTSVKNILEFAQNLLQVGTKISDYNKQVVKCVEEQLISLGLIVYKDLKKQDKKNPLYKKYFMHGISHFLGLDVHDVGYRHGEIKEGMVLTCEPGIYIREENLGIRLENNIVIQKNGNINLMQNIPIEIDEIEYLMQQ